MKSTLLSLLAIFCLGFLAWGDSPPPEPEKKSEPKLLVLLLKNYRILEGATLRSDGRYELRRGKEVFTYPSGEVLHAAESLAEIKQYLAKQGRGETGSKIRNDFATKVQPVLNNLCASCHAKSDHASGFRLARLPQGYADAQALQKNEAAVSNYLTGKTGAEMPLLQWAIKPHGGRKIAPLTKTHPAYKSLELWALARKVPEPAVKEAPKPEIPKHVPEQPPASADPFDPEEFNRGLK